MTTESKAEKAKLKKITEKSNFRELATKDVNLFQCLNVSGKLSAKLETEDYCADQEIYVAGELTQPLLG